MKKVGLSFLVALGLALLLVPGFVAVASATTHLPEGLETWSASGSGAQQDEKKKPWLGIVVADINQRIKERLNLAVSEGVVVTAVSPKGPAETAGIKRGDVITAINGTSITKASEVTEQIKKAKPGDPVTVSVQRGSDKLDLKATLEERPQPLQRGRGPKVGPRLRGLPFWGGLGGAKHTISASYGSVTQASESSITITLNETSNSKTFRITDQTRVLRRDGPGAVGSLKAGDKVVIVTADNSDEARIVLQVAGDQNPLSRAPGLQRQFRLFEAPGRLFDLQRLVPNLVPFAPFTSS